MPPLTPGIGIVWMTLPSRFFALLRHLLPFLPFLQPTAGAASTMRMSLWPRPASSTQRKRPLRVSAPPPGWLPTGVSLPVGESLRPLGWMWFFGPIVPVFGLLWARAMLVTAVAVVAAASAARRARVMRASSHARADRMVKVALCRLGQQAVHELERGAALEHGQHVRAVEDE